MPLLFVSLQPPFRQQISFIVQLRNFRHGTVVIIPFDAGSGKIGRGAGVAREGILNWSTPTISNGIRRERFHPLSGRPVSEPNG
jgi:hypothetical protein